MSTNTYSIYPCLHICQDLSINIHMQCTYVNTFYENHPKHAWLQSLPMVASHGLQSLGAERWMGICVVRSFRARLDLWSGYIII